MNLLTIIGNAVADEDFLDKLFEDPIGTVERYDFHLTRFEQEALLEFTQSSETKEYLRQVYICPKKPCLFALAPPRSDETAAKAGRPKVA